MLSSDEHNLMHAFMFAEVEIHGRTVYGVHSAYLCSAVANSLVHSAG
jgi:hypothetical protein